MEISYYFISFLFVFVFCFVSTLGVLLGELGMIVVN